MIRSERERVFPVPVERGFAYITDLDNWPSYWPGLVHIEQDSRWSVPGDQASLVVRLMRRDVELALTLRTFEPDRLVVYDSVQAGLPDAHHERHFRAVAGGFAYRIVVDYEPRPGIHGLLDKTVVRRGIGRALEQTMDNLERVLGST